MAGLRSALSPDYSKPYGDKSQALGNDRYGTAGIRKGEAEYEHPPKPEEAQRPEAVLKGASVGEYRSGPIGPGGNVVQ